MKITILQLKLLFLVLFAVGCVATWTYQVMYVWPRDKCEARGAWWDPRTRICATPIMLPKLTGRPFGSPPMIVPRSSGDQAKDLVAPGSQSTSPAP
jgi:hypothetical protein